MAGANLNGPFDQNKCYFVFSNADNRIVDRLLTQTMAILEFLSQLPPDGSREKSNH